MPAQTLLPELLNTKWCNRCKSFIPTVLFSRNRANCGGLSGWCKLCTRVYDRERRRKNLDEENRKLRERRRLNRDKILEKYKDPEVREKALERQRRFHKKHWGININHTLKRQISSRINIALSKGYTPKTKKTLDYLGCSIPDLKVHLEKQFTGEMSWDNRGLLWEIDHIIPCAAFDLSDENERHRCFHYTNLQPLEKYNNRKKSCFLPSGEYVNRKGRVGV